MAMPTDSFSSLSLFLFLYFGLLPRPLLATTTTALSFYVLYIIRYGILFAQPRGRRSRDCIGDGQKGKKREKERRRGQKGEWGRRGREGKCGLGSFCVAKN